MTDEKIINWMLNGTVEANEVYRSIDNRLLYKAVMPEYKSIVRTIYDYYSKHRVPPSYNVLESLLNGDCDIQILECIKQEVCSGNEIGYYLDLIKERYNNFLIKGLSGYIEDPEVSTIDINDKIKNVISTTEQLYKDGVFSEGNLKDSSKERVDSYNYTENNPTQIMGVLSGYKELDNYTWGIKNSEMMVIAGGSSSGKSLLMLNMAINAWLGSNDPFSEEPTVDDGKNIVFISLEMSKSQLENRIDANIAGIKHRSLIRGSLTDEEKIRWKKSLNFQNKYNKKFYIIDMPRGSNMIEISAKYESILGIFKPDAFFADYLQLMSPSKTVSGSDWQDVGKVSEELHEFCRKNDIPVITAAQRKARPKKKGVKSFKDQIDLEDIGRSKMIGDNSNIVLLIEYRDEEYLREDMPIHVVKNRDGAKGKVVLKKDFELSRITNLPDGWAEDFGDENEC